MTGFIAGTKKFTARKERYIMETPAKKLAYLKGLAEGLNISDETAEGKLLLKLLDAVKDIAEELENLSDEHEELELKVDEIDEDLADLEDFVYDDEDDDFNDDDDFDDFDDDDDEFFEIECPNCGEDVLVDFDMLDDEKGIVCPNCHESITLEFDDDDSEEN